MPEALGMTPGSDGGGGAMPEVLGDGCGPGKLSLGAAFAETNCRRPLKVLVASGFASRSAKDCRSMSAPISFHGICKVNAVWVSFQPFKAIFLELPYSRQQGCRFASVNYTSIHLHL